jgi:hypothetical protein
MEWVDPRAGLDDVEKRKFLPPPGLGIPTLGRPARSQSLYRLSYPDPYYKTHNQIKESQDEFQVIFILKFTYTINSTETATKYI